MIRVCISLILKDNTVSVPQDINWLSLHFNIVSVLVLLFIPQQTKVFTHKYRENWKRLASG